MTWSLGQIIANRYQINLNNAGGSSGIVYRAHDSRLERTVAIKKIHDDLAHKPNFQARFAQEAQLLAQLSHPNVITLFDFEEQPEPYLVMEHFDENLRELMLRNGLSLSQIIDITCQVGQALAYLHTVTNGSVHGDVKPENVLIKPLPGGRFQAVLTDFGLGQFQTDANQTTTVGTPTYMSPEQSQGQLVDNRSDLYALGVLLYEMLAKQPPFPVETVAEAQQAVRLSPPDLRQFRTDLTPNLLHVVNTLLAKNPEDRFADAETAVSALRATQPPTDSTTPPPPPAAPPPPEPAIEPANENTFANTHLTISQRLPRRISLQQERHRFVIGSNPSGLGCDITLRGSGVAPHHAELRREPTGWFIVPLHEDQPVYVDNAPIHDRVPWEAHNTVRIGTHYLRLNLLDAMLENGRSFAIHLTPSRLELKPGASHRLNVIIRNGSDQRGYYQIKLTDFQPLITPNGHTHPAPDWLTIKHDGIPVPPGQEGELTIDANIPDNAIPGTYKFTVVAEALATNEGTVSATGQLTITQATLLDVKVSSTQLLENQACWITIENKGNVANQFTLELADAEQELYFGYVPEDQVPSLPDQPRAGNTAKNSHTPNVQPLSGIRSLPFLRPLFDPLHQNWVSRWLRQQRGRLNYVSGLRRHLPEREPLETDGLDETAVLPPAFFHPPKRHRHIQQTITIPPQSKKRLGFVAETQNRPFVAHHPHNQAFTIRVIPPNGDENRRYATVSIPPRYRFSRVALFTTLLLLIPLLLWLLTALADSPQRRLQASAALSATHNTDEEGENDGDETLQQTDPLQPPTTLTPTPIPLITVTPTAAAAAETAVSTTTILTTTHLLSLPQQDGHLIMTGKDLDIFNEDPVLRVGDTAANGAARTIVTFNTSSITHTHNIQDVRLILWPAPPEAGINDGIDVFHSLGSTLYVDMAIGGFGDNPTLNAASFSAATDMAWLQIARMERASNSVKFQVALGNNDQIADALQRYDIIAFRLYFELPSNEDGRAQQLLFVSGDAEPENEDAEDKRPYLEITYRR